MPVTSGMEFVIAHYAVIIIDTSACCVKAGRWEVERLSSCVLTKENPGSMKRYCLLKMSSAKSRALGRSWTSCVRVCVCVHMYVCVCVVPVLFRPQDWRGIRARSSLRMPGLPTGSVSLSHRL